MWVWLQTFLCASLGAWNRTSDKWGKWIWPVTPPQYTPAYFCIPYWDNFVCVAGSHVVWSELKALPPPQTSLCQKWLQYQDCLRAEVCTNTLCRIHVIKLLRACCQSLRFDANQSLATPLRMIEVYTSHTFYPTSTNILVSMFSYLCSNGWCIT